MTVQTLLKGQCEYYTWVWRVTHKSITLDVPHIKECIWEMSEGYTTQMQGYGEMMDNREGSEEWKKREGKDELKS